MARPILYVNACVREGSRTRRLAEALLKKLGAPYEEVRLEDIAFPAVDEAFLDRRDRLAAGEEADDGMLDLARQFARAEIIVIAAPYWDLSFPAALKQYFEQINVTGVTFSYSPEGIPVTRCRAKRLYYVTTAGGCDVPLDFGFGYVRALCERFFGIAEVALVKAEGLDIVGADADAILAEAAREAEALL